MQKTKKLKKVNCHPSTKNKTISKTSCLNIQTLNKLKDSFNQKYPEKKIKAKDKKGIFNELQNKFQKVINDKKFRINLLDRLQRFMKHPKNMFKTKKILLEKLENFL